MRSDRTFSSLSSSDIGTELTEDSVLILPIGATEQHGPHLPLSTDTVCAQMLAESVVASATDLDLWLLPTLSISKSNEHTWASGTLSLGTNTLLAFLDDIAQSLCNTPVRKIAFLNGHGGNSALLEVACRDIHVRHGLSTFLLHTILPPDQGGPSSAEELHLGIHGGRDETALMLHLRPDLVQMDRAVGALPEWLNSYAYVRIQGPVRFGWTADELSPSGVIGDPTIATAEFGEELFASMTKLMDAQLREVIEFEFEGVKI